MASDNTYIDDKGVERCSACGSPKQIKLFGHVMPCICKCEEEADRARKDALARDSIIAKNTREAFAAGTATVLRAATFGNDNGKNRGLMEFCRKYAEEFSDASVWLMLYGDVGVGKSYAAAAITNALLGKGLSVIFTTLTQFERRLHSGSKDEAYAALRACDLLVLDVLGISRITPYTNEIMYTVIDERLQTGRPMIVTTNMTAEEILRNDDLSIRRIMSRLYERSYMIECKGVDQRLEAIKQRGALTFDE
jgi:DNA replication protein DnaC